MSVAVRKNFTLAIMILALAAPAAAQVSAGEAKLNLNATISAGYSDDYSNLLGSDHSINGAGTADLSGYYYNPNFLSFEVQPFYNQSRLNSAFQSITASSGVNASAHLFGGTNYPGAVSYSTSFNSSGNFNVPGLANYTTNGDSDNLTVSWGVHRKNLPSLNLSFSNSNDSYSIYGANAQGTFHANTFILTSTYELGGFNLNGSFQYTALQTLTPQFLTGEASENSTSGATSFSLGVSHKLPFNGSVSANVNRVDISTNIGDTASSDRFDTTVDTLTGSASFAPLAHLNVGGSTYYTDNLEGTVYNSLLATGVAAPELAGEEASHDLSLTGYANYEMPAQHVTFHAFAERQQQTFLGTSLASTSLNGTAMYSNALLGGAFNGVLGVTQTFVNTSRESALGLNASANYTHRINRWQLSGGFSYAQDVQTLLIAYTTSGYTYSGSVGRRLRRKSFWQATAGGGRSLLTDQPGSANSNQTYSTSLSLPRFSMSGSYWSSSGNALLTSTGLVTNPLPLPVVNPASVVFFNGKSYSAGIGAHPTRGLTMSASYAKALSGTNSNSMLSNNSNENMFFLVSYQLRKLNFAAGYSRLLQGFSATGTPTALEGSYYVGVSRWFNFF